ncbi:hypothetical protein [Floccifex sp.]|uniref:hypothetical protein n=1 Tax=Floccifex sp. TaxID=2815810 RepID=UPI003F0BA104
MTEKKDALKTLNKISNDLFKTAMQLLYDQNEDIESMTLARFMLNLHESIDTFLKVNNEG